MIALHRCRAGLRRAGLPGRRSRTPRVKTHAATAGSSAATAVPRMPKFRFENFTTANGLPDNHVFSVLVDGDRIWAGTENGLAVYENHAWKTYTTADGLAHRAVLSLALDKRTGDVWAGTMGGLSRVSGGRIDTFTQLNSGLSNDVVYGVSVEGENVWVATAAGACRLDLHTNQWTLYNERNTPMNEIWVYARLRHAHQGVLRRVGQRPARVRPEDRPLGQIRRPRRRNRNGALQGPGPDPRNRHFGQLIVDNIVWAATYFGDSRYDGRYWHNFLTKDSGLPSNFTNTIKGVDANRAWFGTDKGLAYYDGANWAVYRPSLTTGKPEMTVRDAQGKVTPVAVTTAPAHNYVLGIDFQGSDIWVATAKGLSHGILQP